MIKPILVVDDEPGYRNLLSLVLSDMGFRVVVASSGQEAVDLMNTEEFGLVFMDIQMPDMGGPEAIKSIRAGYADLPVVIMTGDAGSEEAQSALALTNVLCLQKPFGMNELKDIVSKYK